MPRLGPNLQQVFQAKQSLFTTKMACDIALQIVDMLEAVHEAGYVFNDLKLDNLVLPAGTNLSQMLRAKQSEPQTEEADNELEHLDLTLVDFGFATKYLRQTNSDKKECADVSGT